MKEERLQQLLSLHQEICAEERQAMLGKEIEVLVECHNKDEVQLKARTRCWKNVIFQGEKELIGTLQRVKVHSYSHQTLIGELVPKIAPTHQTLSLMGCCS